MFRRALQVIHTLQTEWARLNDKWEQAEQARLLDLQYPDFKTIDQLVSSYTKGQVTGDPSYYSGLRADPKYLNGRHLEMIYTGIKMRRGADAARSYVQTVASLPHMAPTNFLIALQILDEENWQPRDASDQKTLLYIPAGEHAQATAFFGTVAFLTETGEDKTNLVRGAFLENHRNELQIQPETHLAVLSKGPPSS
jgi:hypothetical protein